MKSWLKRLWNPRSKMAGAVANSPPDFLTRTPALVLPVGACDCHAHVFEVRDKFPLRAKPGYIPALAPFSEYLKMLRTVGCSRAVLVQPSPYGADHSAMLTALKSQQFQLRGVGLFDDTMTDREFEELHRHGVQGIRVHLAAENPQAILAMLPKLAARIKPLDWHIQFYLNAALTAETEKVFSRLAVPVVIDHFGLVQASGGVSSTGFQSLLRLARSGNAWFKLSAPYRVSSSSPRFADVIPLARELLKAAPDQCVWGTDWPHPNSSFMPNDGDLVDLLADWIPDEEQRRRVLVENPCKLYAF